MTGDMEAKVRECAHGTGSRMEFWPRFLNATAVASMAELGVYRGEFAECILKECPGIRHYYMVDPWRHLPDWNKPANQADEMFEAFLEETLCRTAFAASKRVVLRGRTTEVLDRIGDGELDFAYVDADHTLRGITIDLIQVYPKVRPGGWIGGDDLSPTIWQHRSEFEPTLVFPFVVHFAEAVGAELFILPHAQFLLRKTGGTGFRRVDLVPGYGNVDLGAQFRRAHPGGERGGGLSYWRQRLTRGGKRG